MALNGKVLGTLISNAMADAEEEFAPKVTLPDGTKMKIDTNTPQKRAERAATSKAIAVTIINYFITNTEVIIPQHPSNVAQTSVIPGPGPHAHSTNLPPIPHKIGRIK